MWFHKGSLDLRDKGPVQTTGASVISNQTNILRGMVDFTSSDHIGDVLRRQLKAEIMGVQTWNEAPKVLSTERGERVQFKIFLLVEKQS